jgi:putative salt-induced outer membrane protein YdiY
MTHTSASVRASRFTRSLACAIGALAASLLSPIASADEVTLRNGDRLTGRVLAKSLDELSLETTYAGLVKIRWSEVASLHTDGPVQVLLVGKSDTVRGALASEENGRIRIGTQPGAVLPREIAYINPKPEESGIGRSYTGHINASAAYAHGNSPMNRSYGDAEFVARAKRDRYTLSGRINKASEAGLQTASAWLGSGSYDRFIGDERRFLYLRGSLEHDRFKDLDLRRTVGAGYGWELFETARTTISLRTGLDHVSVDRLVAADENYPALGWGVKVLHKVSDGGAELFHDQEGFWNLSDTEQVTVRSRTGLRVPLMDRISGSLQLNVDWERDPAEGRKPTDSTLLMGLTYAW